MMENDSEVSNIQNNEEVNTKVADVPDENTTENIEKAPSEDTNNDNNEENK